MNMTIVDGLALSAMGLQRIVRTRRKTKASNFANGLGSAGSCTGGSGGRLGCGFRTRILLRDDDDTRGGAALSPTCVVIVPEVGFRNEFTSRS